MEATLYIDTENFRCYTSTARLDAPVVRPRLQSHLKLTTYFFTPGSDPALLTGATFRVALKEAAAPSGSVLALLSAATDSGADYYEFEWAQIDSSALRTLLDDNESAEAVLEIEWTLSATVERVSIPVVINNAWIRTDDAAPNPEEDGSDAFVAARAVCYDRTQTLTDEQKLQALANVGIVGIKSITFVNGCLRFVFDNDDVAFAFLNSGEPPAP